MSEGEGKRIVFFSRLFWYTSEARRRREVVEYCSGFFLMRAKLDAEGERRRRGCCFCYFFLADTSRLDSLDACF